MISDLERKILIILFNFSSQRRRMPTKPELERTTGRKYADIENALDQLVQQQYIFWPDRPSLQTIVILNAWESDKRPTNKPSGSIDYRTKY
ncbi:hypothetical protein D3C76_1524540 [compost metagenome]